MRATPPRQLLVIADDFGIGANTSAGILQLAARGIVTGAALLVNTPAATDAVRRWRQLGAALDLGWRPNLSLDSPLSSAAQVASLVGPDGRFWPLDLFARRWFLGLLDPREIRVELQLQLQRFNDLVGHPPTFVNSHHHVGLFAPVGEIILDVLARLPMKPYVRRIHEPLPVLRAIAGGRCKRALLSWLGGRLCRLQEARGFPGNDYLAGLACAENAEIFVRWLRKMPGRVVELMCRPGRLDSTVMGRGAEDEAGLQQRVNELRWLREPAFLDAVKASGFRLGAPIDLLSGIDRWARCA